MRRLLSGRDESAVADETVQAVLSALEAGEDLSDLLDPTAAGSGGLETADGVQGEGHSWVRVVELLNRPMNFKGRGKCC